MLDNYLIPIIPFHEQVLSLGKGSYVYDVHGKKYLDLNSGQFCTILGHSNEELAECVKSSALMLVHTSSGMVSDAAIAASFKLNRISGDMDARSITLSTGAEAVEFAIRYAKHITRKNGLICFNKGYHGLTLGTQSITFGGRYALPLVNDVFSMAVPEGGDYSDNIDEFELIVRKYKDTVAAVVVEPIVSVGGMIFPDDEYFRAVFSICKANDILFILDESQTGFGRTGKWFCYQHIGIVPDMVICSKGIGLGFPVAVVLFSEVLCQKSQITMTHYSSHQNDPFAANIINFGIDYIEKNRLLESNSEKGVLFLDKLQELCDCNELFVNPRGRGMMLGVDLFVDGIDDYRALYSRVYNETADKGLLIQGTDGGRVLRFLPDYLISEEAMDFCIEVLRGIRP